MKKNKRGRPKITGQLREANGRISRCKTPREAADQLAIEIRAKRFGLTLYEAKNPLSGSYIGRLCLQGVLTQEQYDAAQQYLQIRNNYLCAKGLPNAIYDDVSTNSDPDSFEQWVQKATNRYQAVQEALKETQCLYRQYNLHAALQYLVIEDQMLPHLVNSLRVALNVLQKRFDC
ncbi:hypothetical protein [Bartonella tribocorum]|uniref:Uncharacterized protein n=1 Tax=Bartonella tribocorum (strain DSM 28219 / CCUG 45778 / CIP 105476 / IBS 506) TaxID=382640 RepID=A9ITB7_BART1|nr:hypothetical protein [Bartonella tribocorum]CAK01408.1 hypothetical protein BT_1015 [Bartonella tribocorum CIP 105476]CDO48635.1 hypothetical protein BM1374166_00952 [Bartonella tribocorum]